MVATNHVVQNSTTFSWLFPDRHSIFNDQSTTILHVKRPLPSPCDFDFCHDQFHPYDCKFLMIWALFHPYFINIFSGCVGHDTIQEQTGSSCEWQIPLYALAKSRHATVLFLLYFAWHQVRLPSVFGCSIHCTSCNSREKSSLNGLVYVSIVYHKSEQVVGEHLNKHLSTDIGLWKRLALRSHRLLVLIWISSCH